MKEKNLFDILENAENDSMKRLIDKCPEISDEQLERIYKMSEKKFRRQRAEKERTERDNTIKMTENDVVEGVEHSKRPAWLTPLTTAASILLIAGIAIGSTAMLKRQTKPGGGGGITPAITVSTTTGTGTNIVSTDKNGSTITGTAVTTTTTTTAVSTSVSGENGSEKKADTEFIKPFVGKWKYQESSIQNLDIPESAVTKGIVEINSDATYKYTDNNGNVSTGTITEHNEVIGGSEITGISFSGGNFLASTAFYNETRPYELHFSNSYIARIIRDDYTEQTGNDWKSAYRKELLDLLSQETSFYDPMWDLQDIDGDGIPELLISSGDREDDYVYIFYYENGEAVAIARAFTVDFFGNYGVTQICKEEHLIGWKKTYDSYNQFLMTKFENHQKTEEIYSYDPEAPSYGGTIYSMNGIAISEEEFNNAEARFNSKNWITVGRRYFLDNFSPLLDN